MSGPALLACAAATFALAMPVLLAAGALETGQRAAGAADAAALAAADAASGWIEADPCALAAEVVAAAGAAIGLGDCLLDEASGEARITVIAGTPFGAVEARARAGPPG